MNKKSFILYKDQYETIKQLSNEQAGLLIKTIYEYENTKTISCNDQLIKLVFTPIKLQLDRDEESWEEERNKRSEAGKKGMLNRWHNNVITNDNKNNSVINSITKITDTVNVNANDTVNDIKKEIKKEKFKKPTLEEITEYKKEINGAVDPQHFIDYYESNGWLVGKNHMKDWKATYRNWNRKREPIKQQSTPTWMNSEIKEIEATEEQEQQIEEMLKKFR